MKKLLGQKGQSLIEVLLAMAIASIVLPSLLTGLIASREGKPQQIERQQANALLTEAVEALRSIRERGWALINVDGTYHTATSSGTWVLASGTEDISGFTRSVVIEDVNRDNSGNIVSSGGNFDPSTKKITTTVSWTTPRASSISVVQYFTRYLDNETYTQTSVADFTGGTLASTQITNTGGGEVTLGGSGATFSDWCNPNLSISSVDLPKQGVANAISAIPGTVFSGTGDNASGVSYATVTLNEANPPVGTIFNTFNGYKTNGIWGETGFAYLATDNNAKEVVIVDISTSSPTETGYFNAPGNINTNAVTTSGSVGYALGSDGSLYSFDLTSKSGSRPQLGSLALASVGKKIVISGSYAFIAEDSSAKQAEIVDISNPASMQVVGSISVGGGNGRDIYVKSDGSRAYLATAVSATQPEFFVIDTSTKTGSHGSMGSFDSGGMDPLGVTVVPGNKAIIVGSGGTKQYQVINIATETAPVSCGGVVVSTGVRGVASVKEADGDAFSYIITGDATAELKIIQGFGGGVVSGSYESKTFDAGSTAAFNRYNATTVIPAGTTLTYQFAIASAVSGSCAGAVFSYLGPDGTSNSFFSGDVNPIPLISSGNYQNPGRCLRYKAFFTTSDPSVLPLLDDITFNYNP